jgi:hypothetical protein
MKIFQKKRNLYFNLFLGVLWLAYGLYRLLSTELSTWLPYTFIILSIFYLIQFFYFFIKPVLIIENNQVIYNDLFKSKTFRLDEIVKVKKFAGDITIFTKTDKIGLNAQLFEKESLVKLNAILDALDLEN